MHIKVNILAKGKSWLSQISIVNKKAESSKCKNLSCISFMLLPIIYLNFYRHYWSVQHARDHLLGSLYSRILITTLTIQKNHRRSQSPQISAGVQAPDMSFDSRQTNKQISPFTLNKRNGESVCHLI